MRSSASLVRVRGPAAGNLIDFGKERVRLQKEQKKMVDEIARFDAKLANEKFIANAPEEVIEEQKEKRKEALATKARALFQNR